MTPTEQPPASPKSNSRRNVAWFLFLFAIWAAILFWQSASMVGYADAGFSDPDYRSLLLVALPIGVMFVIALIFADRLTRGPQFPRNTIAFAFSAFGLNLLVLSLAILAANEASASSLPDFPQFVKGLLPFVAVSIIAIARNFMRAMRVWAFTE